MCKDLKYEFYTYKTYTYKVTGMSELKHPCSGKWVPAVMYQRIEEAGAPICVRVASDFLYKFKGVPS